jgi:hypothetical protein
MTDIERFSYRFRFLKSENPFCAAVPEANETFGIRVDDRVGRFAGERLTEPLEIDLKAHCVASWELRSAQHRDLVCASL